LLAWLVANCYLLIAFLPIANCSHKPLLSFDNDLPRCFYTIPSGDFSFLAFQIFINREEVLDLAQLVGEDLGAVINAAIEGIALGYSQNLFVLLTLVDHAQNADRADFHETSGKTRRFHQDQHIQRIVIQAQRARDEAVVAGIVYRRKKRAVQAKDVKVFVILIFVQRIFGNLDDNIHPPGGIITDGKLYVVGHGKDSMSFKRRMHFSPKTSFISCNIWASARGIRMTMGVLTGRVLRPECSRGLRKVFTMKRWVRLNAACAVGIALFLLSSAMAQAQSETPACTSYVLVSAFDHKTGDDIKDLNADDFQAKLGNAHVDIVSATQQFTDRLLILVQTDGTRNEKIEDVVSLATRLARQAPAGKPIAFGVFVKRTLFGGGFASDPKERARNIGEIAEEEPNLGKEVHLYDALHQALAVFGPHQPGDTVLLVTDGYDDGSDHSGNGVEKEYMASGTRLMVMLRRTPSHVSGNFMWNPPEPQIHLMEAMSLATGGTYTMFGAREFANVWQGYMLGIRLPDAKKKANFRVQLKGMAAETHRRSNLYYPERLPPCSTAPPATTAATATR
jgi:hypothetical protein